MFRRLSALGSGLIVLLLSACSPASLTPANAPTPSIVAQVGPIAAASPTTTVMPQSVTLTIIPSPAPTACLEKTAPAVLPPRRSPLEVKFISDGNIWLWHENEGEARKISGTGDARGMSFSDDGQVVAFVRGVDQHRGEIWTIDQDGADLRRLVSAAEIDAMGSAPNSVANQPALSGWVPGAHKLIFSVLPVFDGLGADVKPYGTWTVDVDRPAVQRYTPDIKPVGGLVSPDGRRVAVIQGNRPPTATLSIANVDGTHRRDDVVTLPLIGLGEYVYTPPIVWSPDSKFLRAIVPSSDPFAESATLSTWIIPADEASPREIATFSGFPIEVYLSPNQQYIAFWKAEPPQSNRRELHLARFDGSREVIYQAGYQLEVRGWAPDSVHFVFREGPSGQPQLGNICGEYKPLTDAPTTSGIDWVDSTRFIFIGDNQQGRELRLGAIGEPSILIGAFNGKDATYQVNREDAAIGLPY